MYRGAGGEAPKFWRVTLPTSRFQTDVTDVQSSMVCGGAIKVGPDQAGPLHLTNAKIPASQ